MNRQMLRQGISEHWAAKKRGTRLEQKRTLKKVKLAAEREVAIMLSTMNLYGKDPEDVALALEEAEALAAGEPVQEESAGEATATTIGDPGSASASASAPEEIRARELKAAGRSYSAIAKEVFKIKHASAFYINKVKKMLGEVAVTQEPARRRGGRPKLGTPVSEKIQPEKGAKSRQKVTPDDDGSGRSLALNGNGHGDMVELDLGRFSRLWEIVTGGQVGIQIENGKVTCLVSESSFKKALPVLLDRL